MMDMNTDIEIRRMQVVLADGSRSTLGDPVRAWAVQEGARFMRTLARAIEFSDDPRSRLSKDSAFLKSMKEAVDIASFMDGIDSGLLFVDVSGLQADQINRLSNALDRTAVSVMRVTLEGSIFPRTRAAIPASLLDPWPQVEVYDLVGDVHACMDELQELLHTLNYQPVDGGWVAPPGHRMVFVGDLVDRGPDPAAVLRVVATMCANGQALCVKGNHDWHIQSWLDGKKTSAQHGMGATQELLAGLDDDEKAYFSQFIASLPHQLILDDGSLIVAHAGCAQRLQGMDSERAIRECIFGVMVSRNEDGTPERLDWAADYAGDAIVVQGHVPLSIPSECNNVWDIDTGCAFGNSLTSLEWPAMTFTTIMAGKDYTEGHPTAVRLAAEAANQYAGRGMK